MEQKLLKYMWTIDKDDRLSDDPPSDDIKQA